MNPILVIGGGVTGVSTAVELAEAGKEVILVEKESYLGGNVIRMHNYFPKLCPPACGMEINFRRIRNNYRIKVLTQTEVTGYSGVKGKFRVTLKTDPTLVKDLCTACGECTNACPVERPDSFNLDMGLTKAIFIPHPLAFPQKYAIDNNVCEGVGCGKCEVVCQYGAIDLNAEPIESEIDVHSIVDAVGWKGYDPSSISELHFNDSPDIVSNLEFERLLSITGPGKGELKKPSDGKPPRSVAFVQCAGSRDINHLPYCSAVCCSASLKHALNVTDLLPGINVSIHYIDLRVTGRNEDFLKRVEETERIDLIRGKVAGIRVDNGTRQLVVEFENIAAGKKETREVDMVVLATGIIPATGLPGGVRNSDGFLSPDQVAGIYPAGCVKRPMDVSTSVKDGTSAAIKALKQ